MNENSEQDRDLIEQLDAAGRACQPTDVRWDSLLDRLPPREGSADVEDLSTRLAHHREHGVGKRSRLFAVAASLLIAVVGGVALIWSLFGPDSTVFADNRPIEVRRRGVAVTIFNATGSPIPTLYMPGISQHEQMESTGRGMALVKDQRLVLHLKRGDNVVKFTGVAATIDPTSVRLVSDTDPNGTTVVEQNFEFDLASGDALLKRSLDEQVTCVARDGALDEGFLISYDADELVLADQPPSDASEAARPKTKTLARNQLQAVRLKQLPADLYTRPTLVWTLRTERPGDHETTLTYVCGRASWQAKYVAVLADGGDGETLDLQGWVAIDNASGATYDDAQLKLIAGDVNQVRDPWAPMRPRRARSWGQDYDVAYSIRLEGAFFKSIPKEFEQKSFFEYKLYTLNQPSTIRDRQLKQLSLFSANGVSAKRRYVCRSQPGSLHHGQLELLIQNEKENQLGRPLPKGQLVLTAIDDDGDDQFLSRTDIEHTAEDEELTIAAGSSFDVTYGFRVVRRWQVALVKRAKEVHEFRVRNHKSRPITVRAVSTLDGNRNWSIRESSDPFAKHDSQTIHFDVELQPDSEKIIQYTVDYRW